MLLAPGMSLLTWDVSLLAWGLHQYHLNCNMTITSVMNLVAFQMIFAPTED